MGRPITVRALDAVCIKFLEGCMSSYAIGLKIQVCGSDVDLKHKKIIKNPDFQLVERQQILPAGEQR